MKTPMMILIAGPYRSGTGDDPAKIQANVEAMEDCVMPIYQKGHTPMLGEWLALPMLKLAGSTEIGDAVYQELFHPIAQRLQHHCDAVLRIGGASSGADLMVSTGESLGLQIFYRLDDIPAIYG